MHTNELNYLTVYLQVIHHASKICLSTANSAQQAIDKRTQLEITRTLLPYMVDIERAYNVVRNLVFKDIEKSQKDIEDAS